MFVESNSTYFSDLDIARSHLLCTLFSVGIEQARSSKRPGIIAGGNSAFGVALGAVSCSFKREVKPYEKYEMWTRVLSWDQKWLYIVTHFVHKDAVTPKVYTLYPKQKCKQGSLRKVGKTEDAIIASAISKCVFKKGRLTIPPDIMLQASGLLPPRLADATHLRTPLPHAPPKRSLAGEVLNLPFRGFEIADAIWDTTTKSLFPEQWAKPIPIDEPEKQRVEEWTWERVENERRRGMEMASLIAGLNGLEREFSAEGEALGAHSDLWWLLGLTY